MSKIKESVGKIRDECDSIEENIEAESEDDEDKNGKTRGDPVVELF